MLKMALALIFCLGFSVQALAVNKCKDSAGNVTYQEAACDTAASQSNIKVWKNGLEPSEGQFRGASKDTGAISLITLDEAVIFILQRKDRPFVSFTLHPKWRNDNTKKVRVFYRTQFLDSFGTEIGVDKRGKDLDATSASTATQVLATCHGSASDRFDYKKLSRAVISYRADSDKTEKTFSNVTLKWVSE